MASAQVVETSVNTNNSPSQDYTTNPDDHSNHNIIEQSRQFSAAKLTYMYVNYFHTLKWAVHVHVSSLSSGDTSR